MNCIHLFVIFFSLFRLICCRSLDSNFDRSEVDENEYESDDSEDKEDIDNEIQAEEKGDEKRGINEEQLIDFSGNTYLQRLADERSARANTDPKVGENYKKNVLDSETDERIDASKAQLHPKMGMFNKYVNKLTDIKKGFQGTNDYYVIDSSGNNQQKYKNNIQDTSSKRKYDEHVTELSQSHKKGSKQSEIGDDREKRNINNQRNGNLEDKLNNDDVSIIKEHIKRLSKDEFNDLLHALSDSNIELLKNIFDSDDQIHVSKRDITKKAEAIADSILTDNNQVDFKDKVPESVSEITTVFTKLVEKKHVDQQETEDNTLKEIELSNTTPAPEIDKSSSSSDQSSDNNSISDQNKIKMELINDIKLKSPGFVEDFDNSQQLSVNYPNYFYNDLSNIVDYNSQENNNNKREIKDNLKYLEDSFPKSNNINDDYLNTPLVRVKRRNQQIIKREHSKCNEINYNDNKESYNGYDNLLSDDLEQDKQYLKSNLNAGSSNIGSDTDNVSKVEGVDDNIMLTDGDRSQKSFNYYSNGDDDKYDNSENEKSMSQKQ